jgi:hypothetical protein
MRYERYNKVMIVFKKYNGDKLWCYLFSIRNVTTFAELVWSKVESNEILELDNF